MRAVRTFGSLVVLAVSALPAMAVDIIKCSSSGKADVIMTLDASRAFNHVLSCISGDFIIDLTPCAPNGGYGLSAPTGTVPLGKVVDRWQDFMGHLGGVASHTRNSHQIYFSGGFNSVSGQFEEWWSFTADRLSGEGKLKMKDKPVVAYTCSKATQRF